MPTFVVTGPDGKEYEVDGPEGATPEQALAQVQAHVGASQPQQPQEKNPYAAPSYGSVLKSGAMNMLTNAARLGPIGGALAGVNEGLNNLERFAAPAGAATTDLAAKIASPEIAAGLGQAVNVGMQAAPAVLGFGGKAKIAENAGNAVRNATIKEARDAGYVVPPTAAGGGTFAKAVESVGGKQALGQEASIRNQQVTNTLAKKAAGVAEDEPLTEATLQAARERLAAPYREISEVSPKAKQALEKLQDARIDAKDAWKQYNVQGGSANRKLAMAEDAKVDVLERLIEREASFAGKSGLVEKLREARIAIAKNNDVERALNIGTGDIDAHKIGSILDKRGSKAVTGELGTIGRFAEAFGQFSREAPSGQSGPGVSKLTPYAAAMLGIGGYGASEHYGMGPWGAAAAFLPMLSGPARALALSKFMQQGGPSTSTYGVSPLAALLAAKNMPPPALDPNSSGALYK